MANGGRRVAIRDLLVWAYRDQIVHAARPEGLPVGMGRCEGPRLASMSFGADPVDTSGHGDFEAAFDAWRVHEAVQALPDAEWQLSGIERAMLQTRAMIGGNALAVPAVQTIRVRSVVFQAAVTDRPPDWCPSPVYRWAHQETQTDRRHGNPVYDGRRHAVVGHRVTAVGFDPWQVRSAKTTYAAWIDALRSLQTTLRAKLRDFELTGELPAVSPWSSGKPR